jgi:hypothetical protein
MQIRNTPVGHVGGDTEGCDQIIENSPAHTTRLGFIVGLLLDRPKQTQLGLQLRLHGF